MEILSIFLISFRNVDRICEPTVLFSLGPSLSRYFLFLEFSPFSLGPLAYFSLCRSLSLSLSDRMTTLSLPRSLAFSLRGPTVEDAYAEGRGPTTASLSPC